MTSHQVPVFNHRVSRAAAGLLLALLSPAVAAWILAEQAPGPGMMLLFALPWLPASWLTDKYVHKYPQRYYTYLIASHLKAAGIMALGGLALVVVLGPASAPATVFWTGLLLFVAADALLSLPNRRGAVATEGRLPAIPVKKNAPADQGFDPRSPDIDGPALLRQLDTGVPGPLGEFVRQHLPESRGAAREVVILDDIDPSASATRSEGAGLLVGRIPLNHVNRLNLFLGHCAERVVPGGYLAVSYTPLEQVLSDLRSRYPGLLYRPAYLLHFAWYRALPKLPWLDRLYFSPALAWLDHLLLKTTRKRNRVLPKAEVWGRLAFWGFEVVAESAEAGDKYVVAQRVSQPVANRRPSYYAVVALEKVGLDGKLIRLHKVRSMYPFSEFLQRRLYERHGLTSTGKFKNDFRLTEYGKLIRRHWIDELPGLFDWLRGEIKLVGMRATSPQFLSTYPAELYNLYIQIKPGLIPPIFDESTGGFEAIVATELAYLKRYSAAPIRTDIAYFWYTFRDIVFRRVRSH